MATDDRTELLKTRVTKGEKRAFEDICEEQELSVAEKLREMVNNAIKKRAQAEDKGLSITIWRPDDYDFGAWRVHVKAIHSPLLPGLVFCLPKLDHRTVLSDPEYRGVWTPGNGKLEHGGRIIDGEWRGNLYTNGYPESENPTSLDAVEAEFRKMIEPFLNRFTAEG